MESEAFLTEDPKVATAASPAADQEVDSVAFLDLVPEVAVLAEDLKVVVLAEDPEVATAVAPTVDPEADSEASEASKIIQEASEALKVDPAEA